MGLGRNHYRGVPEYGYSNAQSTSKETHIYVDSTNGNDSHDGLFWSSAKKTIAGGLNALPFFIRHNTALHLKGSFVEYVTVNKHCSEDLYIDGGTDVTVLLENTVADIYSILTVGNSTASWTVDEYAGKWVEIIDGPAAGERRMVQKNSATTLTVQKAFSVSPNAFSFRVVKPATTLSGYTYLSCTGFGAVTLERLYIGGGAYAGVACLSPQCSFSHVLCDSNYWAAFWSTVISTSIQFTDSLIDTNNNFAVDNTSRCGVAKLGSGLSSLESIHYLEMWGAYVKNLYVAAATGVNIFDGCRLSNVTLQNSPVVHTIKNGRAGVTNSKMSIDGSSGVGLTLINSDAWIGPNYLDVSNNGSHGIELENTKLILQGGLSGSGNGGAGIYAHSGSIVHIKNGAPPTISGSLGDFSTNGTTSAGTWAGVDSGTPVFEQSEVTLIKEV